MKPLTLLGNGYEEVEALTVVNDKKEHVFTSRSPAPAVYFALEIIKQLKGESAAEEIAEGLLIPLVEGQIKINNAKNID